MGLIGQWWSRTHGHRGRGLKTMTTGRRSWETERDLHSGLGTRWTPDLSSFALDQWMRCPCHRPLPNQNQSPSPKTRTISSCLLHSSPSSSWSSSSVLHLLPNVPANFDLFLLVFSKLRRREEEVDKFWRQSEKWPRASSGGVGGWGAAGLWYRGYNLGLGDND